MLLKKELRKIREQTAVEKTLDEYIKESMKRHAQAQRTADKILKAKILDQQTRQTLDKIEELDDDEEDDDDSSFGDNLIKDLVSKFLLKDQSPSPSNSNGLVDIVNKLTPEEVEDLKKKFLS